MSSQLQPGRNWINPPLCIAAKNYLKANEGSFESHSHTVQIRLIQRNLAKGRLWGWALCCLLLLHDKLEPSFRSTLTQTQLNSFSNLPDWWTGKYQDLRLSAAAAAYIVVESAFNVPLDDKMRRTYTGTRKSSYQFCMFWLFRLEFSFVVKPTTAAMFPDKLPFIRNLAGICASTQRMGQLCYQNELGKYQQRVKISRCARAFERDVFKLGDSFLSAVEYLLSLISQKTSSIQERLKVPLHCATMWPFRLDGIMETIFPKANFGAVLEPCPWLSTKEKVGLPYFLWDVANKRTVETSTIESVPRYTTISHTWGCWRENDSVIVNGVSWKVPRNRLFDVVALPEILSRVPGGSPYIWLDLVCIPQDQSDQCGQAHVVRWRTYG